MKKYVGWTLAIAATTAAQALAGITYTAVTKVEGGRGADAQNMTVKACVDKGQVRAEYSRKLQSPVTARELLAEQGRRQDHVSRPSQGQDRT